MNWELIKEYIFNGLSIEFYVCFYFFAIFGMIFSMLTHFQRMRKQKKNRSQKIKFNFWYWIKRNIIRFITNLMAIFIIVRFKKVFGVSLELNMFLGFIIGLSIDVIILSIKNFKLKIK